MKFVAVTICCLLCLTLGDSGEDTYDRYVSYEEHSDLCEKIKGKKMIQRASEFKSIDEVDTWVRQNQLCYFSFVNEAAEYPDILYDVVSVCKQGEPECVCEKGERCVSTKVCFDPKDDSDDTQCENPISEIIVADINTLRGLVDIHEQYYRIVDWGPYHIKVEGMRGVKIENTAITTLEDFGINTDLMAKKKTKFKEEYFFNEDGTIQKRIIHSEGSLSAKLIKLGIIKYAHFAKSIGNMFDIPQRFKNDNNVYYIQLTNGVIITSICIVVFIVFTMYLMHQSIKWFCCRKKRVHGYAGVQQTDLDTDTDSK